MIRIAIVEDNEALRKSLENLFNNTEGMKCVLSLNNLLNVVSELGKALPDIILMDIGLPHISGIEGVHTVKSVYPNIQVLMFTVFEDDDKIFDAIRGGASGYILKKTPPEEIVESVKDLVSRRGSHECKYCPESHPVFSVKPATKQDYNLTSRENEILYSLIEGLSYKKIAEKYFVSISTIRTHICNIYHKLHVNSKSEAVAKVLKSR